MTEVLRILYGITAINMYVGTVVLAMSGELIYSILGGSLAGGVLLATIFW